MTNCYLLENKSAAVCIDPGIPAEQIFRKTNEPIVAILLTHAHADHIASLSAFPDVPVYLHPADFEMLQTPDLRAPISFPEAEGIQIPKNIKFLNTEESLSVGGFSFSVYHTPGHTQGSICYQTDSYLFSGDTLFRNSVGRTDFPGGNSQQLYESIRFLFKHLPKNLILYPGHGLSSTIEQESKHYADSIG